jgi:hypothetical protein
MAKRADFRRFLALDSFTMPQLAHKWRISADYAGQCHTIGRIRLAGIVRKWQISADYWTILLD